MNVIITKAAEEAREKILACERYIWNNPETGFREEKTSEYLKKAFEEIGYDVIKPQNIPGFYTVLDTGKPGPTVLVLAEMDALLCDTHPEADKRTGAVHCCGHHAQCAALLGVAYILKERGVTEQLCGKIKLCAVPAEELIEIEYRSALRDKGRIRYFGGKAEFMYRGYFDDVDLAFMVHVSEERASFYATQGGNGCLAKKIAYQGLSVHAAAPKNGINALYAAALGLQAVNSLRETFEEQDVVRVHPIITKGGMAVNAIPDDVRVETFVRGNTITVMDAVSRKVDRAFIGAALSLGAQINIADCGGYLPLLNDEGFLNVFEDAAIACGHSFTRRGTWSAGSTDMGDLSSVMPVIQPFVGGATGIAHGNNYYIEDAQLACIENAKVQVMTLIKLLSDEAKTAMGIIGAYAPVFKTKADYFAWMDAHYRQGDRIAYGDTGAVIR